MAENAPDHDASPEKWLYEQAHTHLKNKNYDKAISYLKDALVVKETAEIHYSLGVIHRLMGKNLVAIANFEAAINIDPDHVQSFEAAAEVFFELGHGGQALDCYACAIKVRPDEPRYKKQFIKLIQGTAFKKFGADLKEVITLCLQAPEVDFDHTGMSVTWLSLLKHDPSFVSLFKCAEAKDYTAFRAALENLPDMDMLLDPYFLGGLHRLIISDLDFEKLLTFLRRFVLEQESALELVLAISRYCHYTDYIFDVSEDEQVKIDELQAHVENENDVAVLSCYVPLVTLKNAGGISAVLSSSEALSSLVGQIEDYEALRAVRSKIETLSLIQNKVSEDVRAQYEEFPYPRWSMFDDQIKCEDTEGYLRDQNAKILVAGCGTGREAVELAAVFPDAQVLAVDLSLTSLAYGVRKSEEHGLKNITFKQADILELGKLQDEYDYITASGVLHHMADPMKGWRVLNSLLKPGCMMRVAFYSELARRHIVKARQVIADKGYTSDAKGIRDFRRDAPKTLSKKALTNIATFPDYYALPECRDLLFHVQEHRYDLLQIEDMLQELGLEFVRFYVHGSVTDKYLEKYRRKDRQARDLGRWAKFEKRHKDSFAGMYRFWCRKPD